MTIEQIEQHVRRLLCNKDFIAYNPEIDGTEGIFYVDITIGKVYIWNGTEYITSLNQVLILTQAQRDELTPTNGLEIYCIDCIGSNNEIGAKQHYQSSTSSWRTFITF